MKNVKFLLVVMITVIVSCTKQSSVTPMESSTNNTVNAAVIKQGDSIIFSGSVYPSWCKLVTNGAEKYLLGDSVYFPINAVITRCGFVITHSDLCATSNTTLLVDGLVIGAVDIPTPWGTFGQLLFDFNPEYHISKGWHLLQFKGYSSGPNYYTAYYNIWDKDYFIATDENGDGIPVKTLFSPKIRGEQGHIITKFRVFSNN